MDQQLLYQVPFLLETYIFVPFFLVDEDAFTSYFDVHQNSSVLSHNHWTISQEMYLPHPSACEWDETRREMLNSFDYSRDAKSS
jgi:hypothetical protein